MTSTPKVVQDDVEPEAERLWQTEEEFRSQEPEPVDEETLRLYFEAKERYARGERNGRPAREVLEEMKAYNRHRWGPDAEGRD